jgi:alanyl-tRNA synthetase
MALTGDQVRQLFLDYFQGKGHLVMPSSSLIPAGDPTLLLTTAGMVQMKRYFLGEVSPPARRMASAQKCFRTTDIDSVGDHKHLTFFEMLGNFSVGDYFKEGAIEHAWEFVTKRLGLDPARLWATVYLEDDEAYDLWRRISGLPAERIYRYGKKDNWWGPPGLEGPCGPCSELHYDFGADRGCGPLATPQAIASWDAAGRAGDQPGCHPNCDRCERFVELWNLVFMQFFQDAAKTLTPLPAPNIDTGMGLERAAVVLQGARTIYETDLFQPIIAKVCELTGKTYGQDLETDRAIRVVAEHARGACFLIADGVAPGNKGRDYVLRRLIRRVEFYSRRRLGYPINLNPLISVIAADVVQRMGTAYPELIDNWARVRRVLLDETVRFDEALGQALEILEKGIAKLSQYLRDVFQGDLWRLSLQSPLEENYFSSVLPEGVKKAFLAPLQHEISTLPPPSQVTVEQRQRLLDLTRRIPGSVASLLYDTYGLPAELTAEIAPEYGLTVDTESFQRDLQRATEAHLKVSRAGGEKFGGEKKARIFQYQDLGVAATRFVGYERLEQPSVVVGILGPEGPVDRAQEGDEVEIVLRETPFYPEGGGQVGDAGELVSPAGRVEVTDTHSPIAGLIVHRGRVAQGAIALGDVVAARVDPQRRLDTARNHSATHLLHAALRQVLGPHVRQAGSLVAPDRLRFDFTHIQALSPEELLAVERLVNQHVRLDAPVQVRETGYTQAVQEGALAFFGEKYGEKVRVITMGREPGTGNEGDEGLVPRSSSPVPSFASKEVCGGTHLGRTGEMGLFFITGESSIGSGLRRIEAVTGRAAEELARSQRASLESLARRLETAPAELEQRAQALLGELEEARKRAAALERELARTEVERPEGALVQVDGLQLFVMRVTHASSIEVLRDTIDWLKAKLGSAVIALGAVIQGRPILLVAVTSDLVMKGFSAVAIAKEAAKVIEGGGGGRPELAQAGGKRADLLDEALRRVPSLVRPAK